MSDLSYVTVREPKKSANGRSSVLMLLHGVGSNERKMLSLVDGSDSRLGVISVRGPVELGQEAYAWFHVSFTGAGPVIDGTEAEASRRALLNFIAKYRATYAVDDVYLMGFSQGAIMASVAALTKPDSVQGAIAFSGRFPKEFLAQIVAAEELKKIALWVGHGVEDQKLPIQHGRATESLLRSVGAVFTYQEFPVGHQITSEMQTSAHLWLSGVLDSVD
jgi:phospholipase/carboxylesterase